MKSPDLATVRPGEFYRFIFSQPYKDWLASLDDNELYVIETGFNHASILAGNLRFTRMRRENQRVSEAALSHGVSGVAS